MSTIGLQTNSYTWLAAALLTAGWVLSVVLCPDWRKRGWQSVPLSLFGFFWAGFGLHIVVRFFMLSYDCVTLGNYTLRLASLSPSTNANALLYSAVYWGLFCLAYKVAARRKTAGPFASFTVISPESAARIAIPMTAFACLCYFIVERPGSPRALITPLALLAGLWIIPATILWWLHFQSGSRRLPPTLFVVLLPGLFRAFVSPYREHLIAPLLIPALTAIVAGKRVRLRTVMATGLIFLAASTVVIKTYRAVKWYGQDLNETVSYVGEGIQENWLTSVLAEPLRRFHALDSLLVTMQVVPRAVPHSGRNVFISSVINGLVPRAIYAGKVQADRGTKFGSSIWAYEDTRSFLYGGGASIAPSTIGDLYEAGGVTYIVIGAVCVGALLGLYEGWKGNLPIYADVALTLLLATQAAGAIERDFEFCVATFIQNGVVLIIAAALLSIQANRNRRSGVAPQLRSVAR